MKDKIFEIENGNSYYVLEELNYENRIFLLTVECELDRDKIKDQDLLVMECCYENGEYVAKPVENKYLADEMAKLLIEKIKN